jgi:hypothetical protein
MKVAKAAPTGAGKATQKGVSPGVPFNETKPRHRRANPSRLQGLNRRALDHAANGSRERHPLHPSISTSSLATNDILGDQRCQLRLQARSPVHHCVRNPMFDVCRPSTLACAGSGGLIRPSSAGRCAPRFRSLSAGGAQSAYSWRFRSGSEAGRASSRAPADACRGWHLEAGDPSERGRRAAYAR